MKTSITNWVIVIFLVFTTQIFGETGVSRKGSFKIEFVADKTTVASGEQISYTIVITNLLSQSLNAEFECAFYQQNYLSSSVSFSLIPTADGLGIRLQKVLRWAAGEILSMTVTTTARDLEGLTEIQSQIVEVAAWWYLADRTAVYDGIAPIYLNIPVAQPGIPLLASFDDTRPPQVIRKDTSGEVTLLTGFLKNGSTWKSLGAEITSDDGTLLPDMEVKFTLAAPATGWLFPERVVTDSSGRAYCGLVMDAPGEYKLQGALSDYPTLAPIEMTVRCDDLQTLAPAPNPSSLQDILEKALPLVSVVNRGNGQIGSAGEKLSVPLTVDLFNRFGQTATATTLIKDELQAWYNANQPGKVTAVQVSLTLQANFQVTEGNATLIQPGTTGSGVTTLTYPLTSGQNQYTAEVIFGSNPIGPVAVRAYATGAYAVTLTYAAGVDPTTIPKPESPYVVMPALFFFGPPEVRLVEADLVVIGKFTEAQMILPWPDPSAETQATAPRYYLEARLPSNEPPETTGGVEILDDCGSPITDIAGKIGLVGVKDLPLRRDTALTVDGRYSVYRSLVDSPLVFITETMGLNETAPTLPTGPMYVQTSGFVKPFALADGKVEGAGEPTVRIIPITPRTGGLAFRVKK